jgi:hypothetical protein
MKYIVINSAPDGRHVSLHSTIEGARKRVEDMVGKRSYTFEINREYYSDWGNVLCIEERPNNWTVKTEEQVAEAFDARECGTATATQLRLLEDAGF